MAGGRTRALVDAIAEEEVVITRRGKPIAKIVRYSERPPPENRYPLRGLPIKVAEDFEEPLPGLWEALQ